MSATLDGRIDAGVAWLDEHVPDWLDRIDTDRLAMASSCRCVLGQTFGDAVHGVPGFEVVVFWSGARTPHMSMREAIGRGFQISGQKHGQYGALTSRWRERITALRAERDKVPAASPAAGEGVDPGGWPRGLASGPPSDGGLTGAPLASGAPVEPHPGDEP